MSKSISTSSSRFGRASWLQPTRLTLARCQVIACISQARVGLLTTLTGSVESIFASSANARKKSDLMANDQTSIYRAQIMALWDNVEGSQRFIPHAQNKHIVRECVNFYEINPKTLQPRQAVHLFLLSDCLLLARRRGNRLVADHCWNIQDLTIVDVKDSSGKDTKKASAQGGDANGKLMLALFTADLTNALRIVVYPETFIYRSERIEDKLGLLNAYKRLIDDNDDKQLDAPQSGKLTGDKCEITINVWLTV